MSNATALAADAATAPVAPASAQRLDSVDLLRGLVMVVMAIDHVRDFTHFGATQGFDPLDLNTTTPAIFFTRWITHFCAPIFSFLAGIGVYLSLQRGRAKRDVSWFLVTRGSWLILLELSVLSWFGWNWAIHPTHLLFGTLWALGWSMIALAALVHLPIRVVAVISGAVILGHNAFDSIHAETFGRWANVWRIAHVSGNLDTGNSAFHVFAFYPLIPWIAVMPLGYASGVLLSGEAQVRRRRLVRLGVAALVAFVVIRGLNVYGDLRPWSQQSSGLKTVLSFLSVTKYPPSLCYLLVTLGTALLLLAWFDRGTPRGFGPILVFGRVPMFYYLLHIPLAHAVAAGATYLRYGHAEWLFGWPAQTAPTDAGWPLWVVYSIWLGIVVSLYPLCRWFAGVKRRNRAAWLTYF